MRSGTGYIIAVTFTFLLMPRSAAPQAPKVCLPQAVGVPGQPGAPDWWTPAPQPGQPTGTDTRAFTPFDPRWYRATSISLDTTAATSSDVEVRALKDDGPGKTSLYFSWYVKAAPDGVIKDETSLLVGIAPFTTNSASDKAKALILWFTLATASTVQGTDWLRGAPVALNVTVFRWNAGSARWVSDPDPAVNYPWIFRTARTWARTIDDDVTIGTDSLDKLNQWVVQLVIPVSATQADGVAVDPTAFRMWHYADLPYLPGGDIPYTWPRTNASAPNQYVYSTGPAGYDFPDLAIWGKFSTLDPTNDTSPDKCAGVSIETSGVGTNNTTNQSRISIANPNTFYANPVDSAGVTVPPNAIKATFRLANWGSQVGDVTSSSWLSPVELKDVADTQGILPYGTGHIEASWALDNRWHCRFTGYQGVLDGLGNVVSGLPQCSASIPNPGPGDACCTNPGPELELHQCMLVELTGQSVVFLHNSAFRNMDFVEASTSQRDADISVAGLPVTTAGKRDVYLYVNGVNMPEYGFRYGGGDLLPGKFPGQSTRGPLTYGTPPPPRPSLTVRAYHDTGLRVARSGGSKMLLLPQTSFGYLPEHVGSMEGWRTTVRGAERIGNSDNHFKVSPPDGGSTRISSTIEAIEPRRFGIGLHVGLAIPQGRFRGTHQVGPSGEVDFEYLVSGRYTAVGTAGLERFGGKGSGTATTVYRAGLGAKAYLLEGRFRAFLGASASAYRLDPGQTRAGAAAGVGVQWLLSHTVAFEAKYALHALANNVPATTYSQFQLGARYRF